MVARVQRWGNSQGLRFPKTLLKEARIDVGDEVRLSVQGRTIVIAPVERVRGRYTLKALVARMPKRYRAREVQWGPPVGEEAW